MIKLPDYKILKKIGSGGMGDVYLAEHKVLETKVAIKSLHNNLVNDESFRKRFKTEAKIHAKLYHPNVVKLIDFQERKDGLFIIMEYVKGQQLDDYIKNETGPIPEKELTSLFSQILDAISHAHSKGLVHRDIKPANVIISNGKIKVLDFGIAKELSTESGLTKTGVQVGTPMYMSPEQVNAEPLDNLTDIYSLGVTLFYMAVGKVPYENSNAMKMGIQIVTEPFPKAKKFYPAVSDKIELIIKKATQKNKQDRYQSCDNFKKDLISSKKPISPQPKTSKPNQATKKNKLFPVLIIFLIAVAAFFYYQNNLILNEVQTTNVKEAIPALDPELPVLTDKDQEKKEYKDTKKEKREKLYNLYLERNLITSKVSLKMWNQMSTRQQEEIFKLGQDRGLFSDKIKVEQFTSLFTLNETQRKADFEIIPIENQTEYEINAELERKSKAKRKEKELKRKADAERKAEEVKNMAKSKNINKKEVSSKIKPEIFFKEAEKERKYGDYKTAIETYSRAINANPNYSEAYYKRGITYVKIEKYESALDDFTKSINLNYNNPNVYRDRAVCKRLLGEWDYCDDYKKACDLGDIRSCSDYDSCK